MTRAESVCLSIAARYLQAGLPVPRHLLPDLISNPWRRYELAKEFFPAPISGAEYEEKLKEIALENTP
jgi:hypothetical protein